MANSAKFLLAVLVVLLLSSACLVTGQDEDEKTEQIPPDANADEEQNVVDIGDASAQDPEINAGDNEPRGEEGGCPEGDMGRVSGIVNVIVPIVPKCILGPNVVNLQLRSPIEAVPRINCVLKCIFSEVGVFGADGRFSMGGALEFFRHLGPTGGGGLFSSGSGQKLQECVIVAENFQPDEYECRSYAPFFQCVANTLMERMRPMMEQCAPLGNGPLRGLLGMLTSVSPMGMLGNGGGGGLMSLLGAGGAFRGLLPGSTLARILGGEAGSNLAGPLNGIMAGVMRGGVPGGMNGFLAGEEGSGGGPIGNVVGGGIGGLLSGRGIVGMASGASGYIGVAQAGMNIGSKLMQGQGELVGAGLSELVNGVNAVTNASVNGDEAAASTGESESGSSKRKGILGMLTRGVGYLRRMLMGRQKDEVDMSRTGTSMRRGGGRFMTRLVSRRMTGNQPTSFILTQLHSNNTGSIVYQLDRVTNLAKSLQLLTNNTIAFV